jgi:hypothetical protein
MAANNMAMNNAMAMRNNMAMNNAMAMTNTMNGLQNDASGAIGLFTPPDGSFSALLPTPVVSLKPGSRVYTSLIGHAKYEVSVVDMVGAAQALSGTANRFMGVVTSQGFTARAGGTLTLNGYPAIKNYFWNLSKKCCVIFCATDNHLITFCATIREHDKNEITYPFFSSLSVH